MAFSLDHRQTPLVLGRRVQRSALWSPIIFGLAAGIRAAAVGVGHSAVGGLVCRLGWAETGMAFLVGRSSSLPISCFHFWFAGGRRVHGDGVGEPNPFPYRRGNGTGSFRSPPPRLGEVTRSPNGNGFKIGLYQVFSGVHYSTRS